MYPATPSIVRQAPDNKALRKTTILKVEDQPLSTPPIAQEYFEPGVNVKLKRRSKPKTNYTLPSDMPTFKLGFVPTNQTPGANGEEPAIIPVKESVPADLLKVFAQIASEEKALASLPKGGIDSGQQIATSYLQALKEKNEEDLFDRFLAQGYDEEMIEDALDEIRMETLKQKIKMNGK